MTISAKQTGSNTIVATSNVALAAGDKVVLKKGSTEQAMTFALGTDSKTVTITTANKLVAGDYTVTVTPADTTKAAADATVTCEATKLAGLKFGKELVLATNSNFYKGYATLTGADQWGNAYDLGSNVQIYASTATSTITYDAASKTVTVTKATGGSQLPFTVGDSVTLTAIYQNGTTVLQQAATLKVSNAAYVASVEFGALNTTNKTLQGKKVTYTNFLKGSYYMPVTAKDQYGNALTAADLTKYVNGYTDNGNPVAATLFVNPTAKSGVYGGFNGFDTLADGTVVMKLSGTKGTFMPGKATISFAGIGGLSKTAEYTVEDDSYIDALNVTFESSLYANTDSTFTVSAKDQYGEAVDLYNQTITQAASNKITFGDANHVTNGTSSIEVNSGTLSFAKKSATKTVEFTYTPSTKGTTVATITTAKPSVSTQTLTVGDQGTAKSIQSTLKADQDTTITKGSEVDFGSNLVFVDSNGVVMATGLPSNSTTAAYSKDGKISNDTTDGYHYAIFTGNSTDGYVNTGATKVNPTKTTTYTVVLYDYGKTKAATATVLDTKTFKITVTSGTYDSYTASVKAGTELLYTGKTYAANGDYAKIVVKGTDDNGDVATLTAGTDYTLSVDHADLVKVDSTNKNYVVSASDDTLKTTANEGTATVTVWDMSGAKVATTTVKYSNAAPVAKDGVWEQIAKSSDATVTTDNPLTANANIDLDGATAKVALSGTDTLNVTASTGNTYALYILDQYGVKINAPTFYINGKTAVAGDFKAIVNTIDVTSGSVTKEVVATVQKGKYTQVANTATLDATTTLANNTASSTTLAVKDQYAADMLSSFTGSYTVVATTAASGDSPAGTIVVNENGTITVNQTAGTWAKNDTLVGTKTVGGKTLTITATANDATPTWTVTVALS